MNILIVALEYLEDDYSQTRDCIKNSGLDVIYADRDGVGNMAKAFNRVCHNQIIRNYDYLWFITNIVFKPEVPHILASGMEGFAALHPAMRTSDHRHQWPQEGIKEAPFVEWTAPMVRTNVFLDNPLDEKLPYWYFDLDWSYRVKQQGLKVGVHHGCEVSHTYLRNAKPHPITQIRKQLRDYWANPSQKHMEEKYGQQWPQLMQWKK